MKRINTIKNQEPIRTPIVRLQDISSPIPANKKTGLSRDKIQVSYSLNMKFKEDKDEDEIKVPQKDSQYLSIPHVKLQTPPLQRPRSRSVPSIENNILMDYYSVKSTNNNINEDLIRISSRHLSFYSPSELSQTQTLNHNKFSDGPKNLIVVNSHEKGHHSERESPYACTSSQFFQNDRSLLEKSKWIWSTLNDDQSKLQSKIQTQNFQFKAYIQRPATPFENKGFRKASVTSLKDINDDIEEIHIYNETNKSNSAQKTINNSSVYSKFIKSFPFSKKDHIPAHKEIISNNDNEKAQIVEFAPHTNSNKFFSK